MRPALLTLEAINNSLKYDQGATFRTFQKQNLPLMDDAYRGWEDDRRSHLGASILGQTCARKLWYTFRWATRGFHEGRILRLFNRGHLEEGRFISLLQAIGIQVYFREADGNQFRVSGEDGHFGGSLDSVLMGVPDLPPGVPCLGEYKTHNDKSFKKLVSEGLLRAKWEHYVQMQVYMGKMALKHALYCAVNKNDDDIYLLLIDFAPLDYQRSLERAKTIVWSPVPTPRINKDPTWYECKFCTHNAVCHFGKPPERSCRVCQFGRPGTEAEGANGDWICMNPTPPRERCLDSQAQKEMCPEFTFANWTFNKD